MAISLKHPFTSPKADGTDATLVQPSNWNAEHTLTCSSGKLLGRTTAGVGAVEEIAYGDAATKNTGATAGTVAAGDDSRITGAAAAADVVPNTRTVSGGGLATGGGALSANQTITVTKSTLAQAQAGTDDTTAMTPVRTKDAIGALSAVKGTFVSADQIITLGGLLTIPHGLGVRPGLVRGEYVCVAASNNWSVGDVADTNAMDCNTVQSGFMIYADATNVYIRFGTDGLPILSKTTGTWIGAPVTASWNLRVTAISF